MKDWDLDKVQRTAVTAAESLLKNDSYSEEFKTGMLTQIIKKGFARAQKVLKQKMMLLQRDKQEVIEVSDLSPLFTPDMVSHMSQGKTFN